MAWTATSGEVRALAKKTADRAQDVLPGIVAASVTAAGAIATRSLRPTPRLISGLCMIAGGIGIAITAEKKIFRSVGTGLVGAGTFNLFTRF